MNRITQHIPGWAGGDDPDCRPNQNEFNTTEELLAIDWVTRWRKRSGGRPFRRYMKEDNCLMAEFGKGEEWWVLGYLKDASAVDLPVWVIPMCDCGHDADRHENKDLDDYHCHSCACKQFTNIEERAQ